MAVAAGEIAVGAGLCVAVSPSAGSKELTAGLGNVFTLMGYTSLAESLEDTTAKQLGNIQTMINDLSSNVDLRFDRVDESLTTIYNTMNQQFSEY